MSVSVTETDYNPCMGNFSSSKYGGGPYYSEAAGHPGYERKRTMWANHVKLQPEWECQFTPNSKERRL